MGEFELFLEQNFDLDKLLLEKNNIKYDYSSVQYNFPDSISKEIINWGKHKVSDEDVFSEKEKYGREDEIHVTVLYGIHSDSPEKVRRMLHEFPPFEIQLGKTSAFTTNDRYDVLKLDVFSDELRELNKTLRKNVVHTSNFKVYRPHVTISYLKNNCGEKYVGNSRFEGKSIWVKNLTFSSTNGTKSDLSLRSF